jgi:putative transposase
MTHQEQNKSGLSILQEAINDGDDAMQLLLQHTMQRVLEEEITAYLEAGTYERTDTRKGYRNGYKPRMLKTRVGRIELMVPKDREGRFQTELFEKYQRNEKALTLAIMEMYVQGVSTRKVKKITEELCGLDISKSQVSNLARNLDEEVAIWRNRPLEKEYPYLVVDARYEDVRQRGHVVSQGVLLVVGVRDDGYRELLGVWCADSENEQNWSDVFSDLKERGLKGVRYIVSDDHKGLVKSVKRHFQGVVWQRCQVHFIRNVISLVAKKDRKEILSYLHEITDSRSVETARKRISETVDRLETSHPKVAVFLDTYGEEILAVYSLPESHRKRMRSTNMLERYNQEIKRRTRVVRIFPNEQSCVRLITALAIETNEEWMARRYLTMDKDNEKEVSKSTTDIIAA